MKKTLLLLIVTACLAVNYLHAATVSLSNAQTVALNFYKVTFANQLGHTSPVAVLKYTQTEPDNSVDFYVFDIQPLNGFVIVSGYDEVKPVIGYSNESYFLLDFNQSGLINWINRTAGEIRGTVQNHIPADEHINGLWAAYRQGNNPVAEKSGSVGPLLATTWSQSPYYNQLCPINPNDGQRSVTGCVATAMAQIMKYWNYPTQGTGSFTYVDDNAHGYSNNIGTLSANFATTTYQWTQMPNHLTSNNTAVATLMSHCGISVAMDYSDGGSGAFVLQSEANQAFGMANAPCAQHSYVNYFYYDPNTISGITKSHYTATQWLNLIEGDLNAGRVIQYEGDDPRAGGHTWVCDGYDVNNNLHMNWGWGGAANGFYSPGNLNAGGYHFDSYDAALIGIQPLHLVADTTCSVSVAFTYQNTGGSTIQFTNNSTSNHAFTSQWRFYNAAGQFSTSTATNPSVTFIGLSPYSASLTVRDTFYGGCHDSIRQTINFNPNTVCIDIQQNSTHAVGANLEDYTPTQNYDFASGNADFKCSQWTHSSAPVESRGLLKFDFSQIPAGSVIVSAHLSLYADTNSIYDQFGQPMYGTDNASDLWLVTSPWSPSTVTWSTQPTISNSNPIVLAQSTVTDQDYQNLDISSFVQGWVANPSTNYGIMLKMITSYYYNTMIFCSPGYALPARWPRLQVCFIPPNVCNAHAAFVPQNLGAGQVLFTNTSTDNTAFTSLWTFYNASGPFATSTQTNPTVTFIGQAPYSARLIIVDSICSDTTSQLVNLVNCTTFQQGATKGLGADLEDFTPTQNYDFASFPDFITSHWTHGGQPTENRSLLKFDLSQIPQGSVILSANLSLYADSNSTLDIVGQPTYGSDNASNLYLVTSAWSSSTVNWNNQPTYSTANPVLLPQTTSVNQDFTNLDVSSFVQTWVNNPANNNGMLLKMITQYPYNTMIFCSPGHANSAKWPKLDICYQVASPCHLSLSFTQQNLVNGQVQFTNTSTINNSTIYNWTFYNGAGAIGTSTLQNPVATFTGPPLYSATLKITDTITGCMDTLSEPVTITTCTITDSFTYHSMGNNTAQFTNTTTSGSAFISNWTFSNANGAIGTSTQVNPTFTFTGPPPYYALLVVSDSVSRSCVDSFSRLIKVVVGINETDRPESNLFIFPNPNNGTVFNVHLPSGYNAQTTQIKVFDITGREILVPVIERNSEFCKLAMGETCQAGVYTVVVADEGRQQCAKLIVVK